MTNALIFSADFDGHRQVHVFVYSYILKKLGFRVFIAGNTRGKITNSFYIDLLKAENDIKIIDTSEFALGGEGIKPDEFIKLQETCKADLTIFAEADCHIELFNSKIFSKRKLRGKTIGLFLRPFYCYEKHGLTDKLRYLKYLPVTWRKDDRLFHEFLLQKFSLLDVALYLDENFTEKHNGCQWLPDVFQQYAEKVLPKAESGQTEWSEKLSAFIDKNKDRFVFLYFGTSQFRRGYDVLLKKAEETGGCFVHCGLRNQNENYVYSVNELRSSLSKSGRLFETDQYIEDPLCIEFFFRSVSHMILPYRNFYGSSGVMLQALHYGIPILAPDSGIMGYWIKKYKLGLTFNEENLSFDSVFEHFKMLDPRVFRDRIALFMNQQSTDNLEKILVNAFKI